MAESVNGWLTDLSYAKARFVSRERRYAQALGSETRPTAYLTDKDGVTRVWSWGTFLYTAYVKERTTEIRGMSRATAQGAITTWDSLALSNKIQYSGQFVKYEATLDKSRCNEADGYLLIVTQKASSVYENGVQIVSSDLPNVPI